MSLTSTNCHICVLKKRRDPSQGSLLRWSLPSVERYLCQRVVAPRWYIQPCPDVVSQSALWFVDDPFILTNRNNWKLQHDKITLKLLLNRGRVNVVEETTSNNLLLNQSIMEISKSDKSDSNKSKYISKGTKY